MWLLCDTYSDISDLATDSTELTWKADCHIDALVATDEVVI